MRSILLLFLCGSLMACSSSDRSAASGGGSPDNPGTASRTKTDCGPGFPIVGESVRAIQALPFEKPLSYDQLTEMLAKTARDQMIAQKTYRACYQKILEPELDQAQKEYDACGSDGDCLSRTSAKLREVKATLDCQVDEGKVLDRVIALPEPAFSKGLVKKGLLIDTENCDQSIDDVNLATETKIKLRDFTVAATAEQILRLMKKDAGTVIHGYKQAVPSHGEKWALDLRVFYSKDGKEYQIIAWIYAPTAKSGQLLEESMLEQAILDHASINMSTEQQVIDGFMPGVDFVFEEVLEN